MNAHKFVSEKGIEEAKRVLSQAKPDSKIYDLISNQYHKSRVTAIPVGCSMYLTYRAVEVKEFIVLSELKQVVESMDTINQLCGLDPAKHTMKIAKEIGYTSDYEQIKQAISDYELVESFRKSTLVEYLDECEQIVNSWPKWKKESMQNAFGFGGKNEKCEVLDMVDVSPNCEVINETH